MLRAGISLAVVIVFALSGPSSAAVVTYRNVTSPSKLISCLAMKYGGPGVECSAPYLPRKYDLDPYFELHPHGKTKTGERGDYVGYPGAKQHTLRYGDTWKRPGIRCSMAANGLTCHNLDGHGFHMQKGHLRRF